LEVLKWVQNKWRRDEGLNGKNEPPSVTNSRRFSKGRFTVGH
jgi:hypothetical protein